MNKADEKIKLLEAELKKQEERHKREREKKLHELKALQVRIKDKERKRRTSSLILAGELCDKAGLSEVDHPTLLGGLLELAKKLDDAETAKKYKNTGEAFLKELSKKRSD